jgi:hypothetical protein
MKGLAHAVHDAMFPHPHFERAVRDAVGRLTFMPPGSVVAMVGPTRVGKSKAIREALTQTYPTSPTGHKPTVVVDCGRTDGGFVSTRYLTLQILTTLEHPFYTELGHRIRFSQTETNARLQLLRTIEHRATQVIVIDEAHHLLRVKNRAGREAALESLKCLGNETGAVIFLVGGYELLSSCFCSAHFNGRLSLIEFPRYGGDETQMRHFCRILASYDELLPWAKGHSLLSMREFIYAGSLGSCGLVANWILIAASEMWATGASKLRKEHFAKARYRLQVDEIEREITYGESVLHPITASKPKPPVDKAPPSSKPGCKPGRRKPKRDPVGTDS